MIFVCSKFVRENVICTFDNLFWIFVSWTECNTFFLWKLYLYFELNAILFLVDTTRKYFPDILFIKNYYLTVSSTSMIFAICFRFQRKIITFQHFLLHILTFHLYRVLPNFTDELREVIVGNKRMKNYHNTLGRKSYYTCGV